MHGRSGPMVRRNLTDGAVAAITFGAGVVLACIVVGCVMLWRRKLRPRRAEQPLPDVSCTDGPAVAAEKHTLARAQGNSSSGRTTKMSGFVLDSLPVAADAPSHEQSSTGGNAQPLAIVSQASRHSTPTEAFGSARVFPLEQEAPPAAASAEALTVVPAFASVLVASPAAGAEAAAAVLILQSSSSSSFAPCASPTSGPRSITAALLAAATSAWSSAGAIQSVPTLDLSSARSSQRTDNGRPAWNKSTRIESRV